MGRIVSNVQEFDPTRIKPLKGQPRSRFRGIRELADSITEIGQTNPGKVILLDNHPNFDAMLVDGERRLAACKLAGRPFTAMVVGNPGSDDEIFTLSFASNFGKQPHDCLEIAVALGRLQRMGKTQKQMAVICSASTAWVSQHLAILQLDPEVQQYLVPSDPVAAPGADGNGNGESHQAEEPERVTLPLSIVPILIKLPSKAQRKAARTIVYEGLSLSAAQRLVMRKLQQHGVVVEHEHRIRRMTPIADTINQVHQRVGIHVDLVKSGQFGIVLEKMSIDEKEALVEAINQLNDDLSELADAVEVSMRAPKPPAMAARSPALAKSPVSRTGSLVLVKPMRQIPDDRPRLPPKQFLKKGEW